MRIKKMKVKDLISIGIYTALYFATVGVSALLVIFLIPGYSYMFIPVVSALLSGTIFLLMVAKVPKFGAITIMGSIMGIWFFMAGRFVGSLIICVGIALLADFIAYLSKYKNKAGLLGSYIVFSFSTIGPVVPMLLFPTVYADQLVKNQRSASYIDAAFTNISEYTMITLVIGIIVMSIIGGFFGQKMLRKHFEKSGMV